MHVIIRWFVILVAVQSLKCFAADAKSALDAAYNHEFSMSARYSAVLAQFGQVRPFSNLFRAEERHKVILTQQYQRLSLELPRMQDLQFEGFRSVEDACNASLEEEYRSVALYDELLSATEDPALIDAFRYLRSASADRHIPALKRCGGW